jgi:hypothetical protein
MQMEMCMKENGRTIKLMEWVHTLMQTEQIILVNGKKINSMGKERNPGQTVRNTQGITLKGKRMGMDCLNGQTAQIMKVNLRITIFKGREYTNGPMEEGTKEIGKITKCMAKGNLLGKMEGHMKAIIKMIKKKALEFLHGLMEENMWATGI